MTNKPTPQSLAHDAGMMLTDCILLGKVREAGDWKTIQLSLLGTTEINH